MKGKFLTDFEKWKKLNTEDNFSVFDYVFHITKQNKINSDMFFAFLDFFWPSFVIYKELVFLKDNFSKEAIEDLSEQKQNVEYWSNLLLINPYFEKEKNIKKKSNKLIKSLKKIWEIKLNHDFPEKTFIVEDICDSEAGDYAITFYQAGKK